MEENEEGQAMMEAQVQAQGLNLQRGKHHHAS